MNEITEMMADMVKNIALLLMEKDKELSMEQALSTVFNSDTYRKIMDERTRGRDCITKVQNMFSPFWRMNSKQGNKVL